MSNTLSIQGIIQNGIARVIDRTRKAVTGVLIHRFSKNKYQKTLTINFFKNVKNNTQM